MDQRPQFEAAGRIAYAGIHDFSGATVIGISGSGTILGTIAASQIAVGASLNTVGGSAALTFDVLTGALTVGAAAVPGGVRLVGTGGNYINLASNNPSANRTLFLPDAAPATGNLLYISSGTTQSAWTTGLTWSSPVLLVTNTTNADGGFLANNTLSGTASQAGAFLQTTTSAAVFALTSAGFTPANLRKANQLYLLGGVGTVEMLFELSDAARRFAWGMNAVEIASLDTTNGYTIGLPSSSASPFTGRLRLFNASGTTSTTISAGNAAASLNLILPATSPTAGQALLASAPSGSNVTLSWGAATAALTATQVGFGSGGGVLTGSADLTYADSTGVFDLTKTGLNSSVRFTVANASAGTAAQARFGASADVSGAALAAYSSTFTTSGLRTANSSVLDLDGTTSVFLGQSTGQFKWGLGTTEYARMTTTVYTLYGPTTGSVTGLTVTSAAAGSGVTIGATSSGSNENLTLAPLGTGKILASGTGKPVYSFSSLTAGGMGTDGSNVNFYDGGGGLRVSLQATPNLVIANNIQYGISSTSNPTGASDIGFARLAANVGRITSGSTGAGQLLLGTSTDTASAQLTVLSQNSTRAAALFVGASGAAVTQRVLTLNNASLVDLGGVTAGGTIVLTNLGTAPSASITDAGLLFVKDVAAGDANWFVRNETGEVAQLGGQIRSLDQDFNATTTTLGTVTGSSVYGNLSRNVEAGKVYEFEALIMTDDDTTGGGQVAINGTCTATSFLAKYVRYAPAGVISHGRLTSKGATNGTAAAATLDWLIKGTIVVNAAGTLTIEFAQNAGPNGTSTVKAGSYLNVWLSNV